MAEEPSAPTSEIAPMVEEPAVPAEEPVASEETGAPEEERAKETPLESSEAKETLPAVSDHKRKLEDLEKENEGEEKVAAAEAAGEGGSDGGEGAVEKEQQIESGDAAVEAKRPRLDGEADGSGADVGQETQEVEATPAGNGEVPSAENIQPAPVEIPQKSDEAVDAVPQQGVMPLPEQQATTSRKIEVPNNKVGVLIGKAGETIKLLQSNSGAKIQITRDADADPNCATRPVELIGTLEHINKAERLIKDVIAEADAGGSPALVASGFGTVQSGSEQHEIQVPNEKVGLIIGKGGETIKNLQTKSGARIQLIPQHLPEGDVSKERTVRVTGNKKQTEAAKELIKEVMNQAPSRSSHPSGGYNQSYRPRGPAALPHWGPRAPSAQSQPQPNTAYDYQQRGTYPPQSQYPQSYGSAYPQQPLPRSSHGAGWDQRPAAPVQAPQTGGYDYYGSGGQAMGTQPPNPASAPTSAPVNYNYGQPQAAGYGQPNPYPQSTPSQQNYGHGYNEPKYENQAPSQPMYGGQQQPMSSQPGFYPSQGSTTPQTGYAQQQPYSKPAAYGGASQSYGPPRATQPGDPMYQGSLSSSYGATGPTQQSYPYGSSAPSPQPVAAYGQTYGPTTGGADGYNQPPSAAYSQSASQVAPGYGQGGQSVPAYTQPAAQSGGYGQYPSTQQPGYGDQQTNSVNYGYQGGPGDAVYSNSIPSSGYSAPQSGYGQAGGYGQPPAAANPGSYDQSGAPQSGYGAHPGSAPVGYAKGVSPQPGYAGQYDSVQMYGHH